MFLNPFWQWMFLNPYASNKEEIIHPILKQFLARAGAFHRALTSLQLPYSISTDLLNDLLIQLL